MAAFRHYQLLIGACDTEIEQCLETFKWKVDPPECPTAKSPDEQAPSGDEPHLDFSSPAHFDLQTSSRSNLRSGPDRVPGIHTLTAQILLSEVGPDFAHFASGSAFTSWLGLCPDNRVSGGKVLSAKTRKVKNRAATALLLAAQTLHRSQSYLGHFYRRMRAKLGAPRAITATAHKLARIIYHMVTTRQAYGETICLQNEMQKRQRLEASLRNQARQLGFQIVAANAVAA